MNKILNDWSINGSIDWLIDYYWIELNDWMNESMHACKYEANGPSMGLKYL